MEIKNFPKVEKLIRENIHKTIAAGYKEQGGEITEDIEKYFQETIDEIVNGMLEHNISYLYPIMDGNNIIVLVNWAQNKWSYAIWGIQTRVGELVDSREEAEKQGLEEAIKILEEKL